MNTKYRKSLSLIGFFLVVLVGAVWGRAGNATRSGGGGFSRPMGGTAFRGATPSFRSFAPSYHPQVQSFHPAVPSYRPFVPNYRPVLPQFNPPTITARALGHSGGMPSGGSGLSTQSPHFSTPNMLHYSPPTTSRNVQPLIHQNQGLNSSGPGGGNTIPKGGNSFSTPLNKGVNPQLLNQNKGLNSQMLQQNKGLNSQSLNQNKGLNSQLLQQNKGLNPLLNKGLLAKNAFMPKLPLPPSLKDPAFKHLFGHDFDDFHRFHDFDRFHCDLLGHCFGGNFAWCGFVNSCGFAPWFSTCWPYVCSYPWVFGFYNSALYANYGFCAPYWNGFAYSPWWDWCDAPFVYYYYQYPARFAFNLDTASVDAGYTDIYEGGANVADATLDRPLGIYVPGHYEQSADDPTTWVWEAGYYTY